MKTKTYKVTAIEPLRNTVELQDTDGNIFYAKLPADKSVQTVDGLKVGEEIELLQLGISAK